MKISFMTAIAGFIVAVGLLTLANSAFIVDETNQVVITQFGQPMGESIRGAGLRFKVPFIQKAVYFDKRLLEWEGYPEEIPTKDKKFIWVDTIARWRIDDPLQFLQTMGTERQAQSRMDDIIDGAVRDFVTKYDLIELVRNSNRLLAVEAEPDREVLGTEEGFRKIEVGRDKITREIVVNCQKAMAEYGIEIVDVRIKRINYVESVRKRVYERMIAERKRAAEKLRSEGSGIQAEIAGERERDLQRIRSEAYRQAQAIKGKADAESTQIYAEAYSKDPEFYSFLKSLELYPETLKGGRLILSSDSDYLKYLRGPSLKETTD